MLLLLPKIETDLDNQFAPIIDDLSYFKEQLQNATNDSLERVFKELHPHFLSLASNTNTYAVHVLKKMLDGAAVSLYIQPPWTCGPSTPSHVVEHAYHLGNAAQKQELLGELYSTGLQLFKHLNSTSEKRCTMRERWVVFLEYKGSSLLASTTEVLVDISNTKKLLEGEDGRQVREKDMIVVGESGLFIPDDIAYVQAAGVKAVLVGESIVKQNDPEKGIARLFGRNISQA
ncbi:hypothetical protein Bca52824_040767 [Brassica carinata]|uniref:indole-3-glycerol-phosphate synthase n=1 Tax=Brassica carinata TaxID=52824 RepID=A0A8X7RRL3_BRACI|nr:hypothetical protein Bca52824_040767 [Brassica carinata]